MGEGRRIRNVPSTKPTCELYALHEVKFGICYTLLMLLSRICMLYSTCVYINIYGSILGAGEHISIGEHSRKSEACRRILLVV